MMAASTPVLTAGSPGDCRVAVRPAGALRPSEGRIRTSPPPARGSGGPRAGEFAAVRGRRPDRGPLPRTPEGTAPLRGPHVVVGTVESRRPAGASLQRRPSTPRRQVARGLAATGLIGFGLTILAGVTMLLTGSWGGRNVPVVEDEASQTSLAHEAATPTT